LNGCPVTNISVHYYAMVDDAHADTYNPMVGLSKASAGQYDIWVGSYSEEQFVDGNLVITERDLRT